MDNQETKQWIMFYQTIAGSIKFKTNDMDTVYSKPYNDFFNYLSSRFIIQNFLDLKEEVDKFNTIVLFQPEGNWDVHRIFKRDCSFDELYNLNIKKYQEKIDIKQQIIKFSKDIHNSTNLIKKRSF